MANAPARGAAANTTRALLGQLSGKVATLGWTLVATRVLLTQDFGALAFALALGSLLVAGAEWGFDAALLQCASRDPRRASELFSQSVVCQALAAVVVFSLGAAAATRSRPSGTAALVLVTS